MPDGALYWWGNLCSSITGGWDVVRALNGGSVTFNLQSILHDNPLSGSNDRNSYSGTANKIDFTNYTKLRMYATNSNDTNGERGIRAGATNQAGTDFGYIPSVIGTAWTELTLSKSGDNQAYVCIYNYSGNIATSLTAFAVYAE